jgi:hypothetical protein
VDDGRPAAGPAAVAYRERGSPGLIPARSGHRNPAGTAGRSVTQPRESCAASANEAEPADVYEALTAGKFFRLAGPGGAGLAIGRRYDPSGDRERAPLGDFGAKNWGATTIEYRLEFQWQTAWSGRRGPVAVQVRDAAGDPGQLGA